MKNFFKKKVSDFLHFSSTTTAEKESIIKNPTKHGYHPLYFRLLSDYSFPFKILSVYYHSTQEVLCLGTRNAKIYLFGKKGCQEVLYVNPKNLDIRGVYMYKNMVIGECVDRNNEMYLCFWDLRTLMLIHQMKMKRKIKLVYLYKGFLMFVDEMNINKINIFNLDGLFLLKKKIEFGKRVITDYHIRGNDMIVSFENPEILLVQLFEKELNKGVSFVFENKDIRRVMWVNHSHFIALYEDNSICIWNKKNKKKPCFVIDLFLNLVDISISSVLCLNDNTLVVSFLNKKGDSVVAENFYGIYILKLSEKFNSIENVKCYYEDTSISKIFTLSSKGFTTYYIGIILAETETMNILDIETGEITLTPGTYESNETIDDIWIFKNKVIEQKERIPRSEHTSDKIWPLQGGDWSKKNNMFDLVVTRYLSQDVTIWSSNHLACRFGLFYNIHNNRLNNQNFSGICKWSRKVVIASTNINELSFFYLESMNIVKTKFAFDTRNEYMNLVRIIPVQLFYKLVFVFENNKVFLYDVIRNKIGKSFEIKGNKTNTIKDVRCGYIDKHIVLFLLSSDLVVHVYSLEGDFLFKFNEQKEVEEEKDVKKKNLILFETLGKDYEKSVKQIENSIPPILMKQLSRKDLDNFTYTLFINRRNLPLRKIFLNRVDYILEIKFADEEGFSMFSGTFEFILFEKDLDKDILLRVAFDSRCFKVGFVPQNNKNCVIKEFQCEKVSVSSSMLGVKSLRIAYTKKDNLFDVYSDTDLIYSFNCDERRGIPEDTFSLKNIGVRISNLSAHIKKKYPTKDEYLHSFLDTVKIYCNVPIERFRKGKTPNPSIVCSFLKDYLSPTENIIITDSQKTTLYKINTKKNIHNNYFVESSCKRFSETVQIIDAKIAIKDDKPIYVLIDSEGNFRIYSLWDLTLIGKEHYLDLRLYSKPRRICLSNNREFCHLIGGSEATGTLYDLAILRKDEKVVVAKPSFYIKKKNRHQKTQSVFSSITNSIRKLTTSHFYDDPIYKEKNEESAEFFDVNVAKEKLYKDANQAPDLDRVIVGKEDGLGSVESNVGELNDTINIMKKNRDLLKQRGDDLQRVEEKTNKLRMNAKKFLESTKKLHY